MERGEYTSSVNATIDINKPVENDEHTGFVSTFLAITQDGRQHTRKRDPVFIGTAAFSQMVTEDSLPGEPVMDRGAFSVPVKRSWDLSVARSQRNDHLSFKE